MNKKIIAVTGATGAQGGGLARAILADPKKGFAVRALTRDPRGAKARALAALGADVVAADLDRVESLKDAFKGAHGAFCVTPFWEHLSPDRELQQARSMAQAAKEAGIRHAVWSTLEDTRQRVPLDDPRMPTLKGRYKVPHYDAKGEANRYFTELGVPTTFLYTSFYWDNLIHFGMGPKPGPNGTLVFTLAMGDKKLPGMAAGDIGPVAYEIFKRGAEYVGRSVAVAGEHLTGGQMAAALTRALGRSVVYHSVTPDTYRAFGFPGADDLGNMFQYKQEFEREYCGARDLEASRALLPRMQTFSRWLESHTSELQAG